MPLNKGLNINQAKAAVISAVAQGSTIEAACKGAGRTVKAHENWRASDKEYARQIDEVRSIRKGAIAKGADADAFNLSFAEWRLRYLRRETYPHMQNMIDVVEGREPGWLHPSMMWEPKRPNRAIINIPPFHAKTQTVTVDYVTYKLTQNPNFRVVVVSKRQEQAKKFLGQIRQRLTSNLFAELQATYGGPSGFKGDGAKWTQNMLYLAGRDSDAADASIEALGIGGQIYGTRSDLIILDDCVVGSNAAEYEKQINWLESEVENRVFDGKILIIGTRLAPNDMYSELRSGERYLSGSSPWSYLRMPMVLEYAERPADWVTLWPKSHRPMDENDAVPLEDGMYQAWDGVRASQTRDSKPPRTWNLVYQQMDAAEDAVFDAKCVQGSIERRRKPGPLSAGGWGHPRNGSEGMQTIMSVDPAGTGEAFCLMYAVNKADKKRYVLNAWTARNTTPAWYADLIEANHQVYGFGHLVIESNAYASWIIEDQRIQGFCRSAGVRIIPHYTGRNKQNPHFGVASLAPLLGSISRIHDGTGRGVHEGNNLVEFPDPDYSPGVKALIDQLISWQPNKLGKQLRMDGPMAWWFAELVARNMIGAGQKLQPFMKNEYLSRGDLADRKVVPSDHFKQLYA